jgi:hypothetical protein
MGGGATMDRQSRRRTRYVLYWMKELASLGRAASSPTPCLHRVSPTTTRQARASPMGADQFEMKIPGYGTCVSSGVMSSKS